MEDADKYDVLGGIQKLEQPVLLIVGSKDKDTPAELQQKVFEIIPSKDKELHIIDGAEHTFRDNSHLNEIRQIIKAWVKKY
jgi:pimeloyl-ACP methyl ester carboxylesterase